MTDFLLEVGCDEIPARYLPPAIRDLRTKAESALSGARMSFDSLATCGTPRRLVLSVTGLSEKSQDAATKVRGPARRAAYDQDGNPTKALLGFARSLGLDPSQVTVEEVAGVEYVHGERREAGRPAPMVLAEIMPSVVMGLESPYPLRWGKEGWRWYRPIRWVVALLGPNVVPMSIAGITSGRTTQGHRTLHPGPMDIPSARDYFAVMDAVSVVVDPDRRAKLIVEGAKQAARGLDDCAHPVIDDELLSEVASLCEHPAAFLGRFEAEYSALPKEVLVTAMRHHQRYFPVEDVEGNTLPGFIGVRDGDPVCGIDTVRSGNEWVLRARLKDARFFFEQDRKVRLEDRLPELAGVRFLRNSGTMLDKAGRLERLAGPVAAALGLGNAGGAPSAAKMDATGQSRRRSSAVDVPETTSYEGTDAVGLPGGGLPAASPSETAAVNSGLPLSIGAVAKLAKVDLVTAMVREFPELEGVMGGRYAELEGYPPAAVAAIRDQYLPRGAKDRLPERGIPSAVALADKLDTLAVAFSLGMEVSGSADPFALRRHAIGVVAILMGGYDADLTELLKLPLELAAEVVPNPAPDRKSKMLQFLISRVEGALLERGFSVEVTRAALGGAEKRVARLPKMADALTALIGTSKLADVVTGWRRTSVLAKGADGAVKVSESLLAEEPEKALYAVFMESAPKMMALYESEDYAGYLDAAAKMRAPIDRCLDEVLINAPFEDVKANRLALLKAVSELYTRFADFSHVLPLVSK